MRRRWNENRGQSFVEFAFIMPFLVFLVLGDRPVRASVAQLLTITDAARVGAREAAMHRTTACSAATTKINSLGVIPAGQHHRVHPQWRSSHRAAREGHDHLLLQHRACRGSSACPRSTRDRSRFKASRRSGSNEGNRPPAACAKTARSIVFVIAILTVLIGMGALVIDGGSWFRPSGTFRRPRMPPRSPVPRTCRSRTTAQSTAITTRRRITRGCPHRPSRFPRPRPVALRTPVSTSPRRRRRRAILAKIFGAVFNNVTITAHARAGIFVPSMMKNVAPIAVKREVACAATSPACYGQRVTFNFDESNVVLEHDRADRPHLPLDSFDCVRLVRRHRRAVS